MITVTQSRTSIYIAIGFAMFGTFLDLFGSVVTYIGGLPEQTSPYSIVPIFSMTVVGLMMPSRVDPNARSSWWEATRSRHTAWIAFILVLCTILGGLLIAVRHNPALSTSIVDVLIEALFIIMLVAVPRPDPPPSDAGNTLS